MKNIETQGQRSRVHISKLSLVNYRNFDNAKVIFAKGINTVIGENGSGKTNLFRAIRLLLDDNLVRSAYRIEERDFHRGLGDWRGHWIIISLEFEDVSADEAVQSLFLHGTGNLHAGTVTKASYTLYFRPGSHIRLKFAQLKAGDAAALDALRATITLDDYETIFTGKATADFNDPATYVKLVGDFNTVAFNPNINDPAIGTKLPSLLAVSKEVSFTFIQALRDVVSEFQNNRTNPLLTLLKSKSGAIDPVEFAPIIELVANLNTSIEKLKDVQTVRTDITATIKGAAGEAYSPTSLSIKSDLPQEADRLFQALKLFVGESEDGHEGAITELSLGGANLIYLTLKLLEFRYQREKESFANFLLIEEPEAHIHTHIQKTLFDRLNFPDTQIIYSTHSTQISEVSKVQNMNILGKKGGKIEVFQPWVGLDEPQVTGIQRYLDAVRCNLLFARSVLLVEGDAEEILVPILVKTVLGVTLDELGISLINIRSTGFTNIAVLFDGQRVRKRCGIVTDLDAAFIDTMHLPTDTPALRAMKEHVFASQMKGVLRKTGLDAFVMGNPWVQVFYAPHTFEVDFVGAGNQSDVARLADSVYTAAATIAQAKSELGSGNIALYGSRVLAMARQEGKGWFAILLSKAIHVQSRIPDYLLRALLFAQGTQSNQTWGKILRYRLSCQAPTALVADTEYVRTTIELYEAGIFSLVDMKDEFQKKFPADAMIRMLELV